MLSWHKVMKRANELYAEATRDRRSPQTQILSEQVKAAVLALIEEINSESEES